MNKLNLVWGLLLIFLIVIGCGNLEKNDTSKKIIKNSSFVPETNKKTVVVNTTDNNLNLCNNELSMISAYFKGEKVFTGKIVNGEQTPGDDVKVALKIGEILKIFPIFEQDVTKLKVIDLFSKSSNFPKYIAQLSLDTEIVDPTSQNLILIGGPCENILTKKALNDSTDCNYNLQKNQSMIKVIKYDSHYSLIILGDKVLAAKFLENRASELKGTQVILEGDNWETATTTCSN